MDNNELIKNKYGMVIRKLESEKKKEKVVYMYMSIVKNAEYRDMIKMVIPKSRQKYDFSLTYYENNVNIMQLSQNYRLVKEEDYLATVSKLLDASARGTITESYLLSAPNSFGKTTLVNTILKRYIYQDKKVVPYISLSTLAELRFSYEQYMKAALWGNKSELKTFNDFSWHDWLEADFVAVRLTDIDSAVVESSILYSLLSYRGEKELPTLVTMDYTLKPYMENEQLRRVYWDNMLVYNQSKPSFDRLIYKVTYKQYIGR